MVAMEQSVEPKTPGKYDITWNEMIMIARELHQYSGDQLDVHPLLWAELNKPGTLERKSSTNLIMRESPKLKRRNTNEKISDGLKSVCDKLLGIRKISSTP